MEIIEYVLAIGCKCIFFGERLMERRRIPMLINLFNGEMILIAIQQTGTTNQRTS